MHILGAQIPSSVLQEQRYCSMLGASNASDKTSLTTNNWFMLSINFITRHVRAYSIVLDVSVVAKLKVLSAVPCAL